MTIRKKWIITAGIIAVVAIIVNSLVLGILTRSYFNSYLDESYEETCNEIIDYITNQIESDDYSESEINVGLETFLDDSIIRITAYNSSGDVIAEVSDDSTSTYYGMGMMMRSTTTQYNVIESFDIEIDGEVYGEVHITRISTSANSYASIMFQNSLIRNSIISLVSVIVIIFIMGWIMSKKVSSDLKITAEMAQNIDVGKENNVNYSKTKEIMVIQQSLDSLKTRLKLKNTARKTLVDEMVHQTRTPLSIIKMHLEGVEDGLIEMNSEEIKICEDQVDNLTNIIKNVSELIDAGTDKNNPVKEEFDFGNFIRQIYNGMKTQFYKKNISFNLLNNEKVLLITDKYSLGQSIYNILTNAYKFTPDGGKVDIKYFLEKEELVINIQDSGIGINDEDKKKIFDAYYKKNPNDKNNGEGIGLYIVKQNIENINGKILVESEIKKGSTFIIKIPIKI